MTRKIYALIAVIIALTLVFSIASFADPDDETAPSENNPTQQETETQPTSAQTPSPEPMPSPTPSPSPAPVPSPTPSPEPSRSSDSTLSELTVTGVMQDGSRIALALSPEFNPNTTTYSIEAPAGVERLEISAKATHSAARVSIPEGYLKMDAGQRNVSYVDVRAEDGSSRRYRINTNVSDEVTTEPTTEPESSTELTVTETETVTQSVIATTSDLNPDKSEKSVNMYTKLAVVFGCCGVVLLIAAVVLIKKYRVPQQEDDE